MINEKLNALTQIQMELDNLKAIVNKSLFPHLFLSFILSFLFLFYFLFYFFYFTLFCFIYILFAYTLPSSIFQPRKNL